MPMNQLFVFLLCLYVLTHFIVCASIEEVLLLDVHSNKRAMNELPVSGGNMQPYCTETS